MEAEPVTTIVGMSPDDETAPPGVSVVLPVRNEEQHLRAAVERVLAQRYDGPFEVVLAVGPSEDATARIAAEIAASDPRVHVVDNPSGRTAAGLNLAIAASSHGYLVRVDGHAEIAEDYVARCVDLLRETGAANVGGMMVPVGRTPFEQAVARAMSSPLGIGAERFHTGGHAGPAPTVYLGAFRRDAVEAVGGFDEEYIRAQDWELNYRLRAAGEVVWFDPGLGVDYRPRGSVRALARQFHITGRWRREVVRRHRETANLRYLAPPAAVVGCAAGTVAAAVGAAVGPRWLLAGAVLPVGYLGLVSAGSLVVGRGMPTRARAWLPVVLATMHLTWGAGFLRGLPVREPRARRHYPVPAHDGPTEPGALTSTTEDQR
jgi:succinoglycan biosynthesis protein ExoA